MVPRTVNTIEFKQTFIQKAFPIIQQNLKIASNSPLDIVAFYNSLQVVPKIDWNQIDTVLDKKAYKNKRTFSEKYFLDVIRPYLMQKRSNSDFEPILQFLEQKIVANITNFKQLSDQHAYATIRGQLMNEAVIEFNLKDETTYCFKPAQDKLRNFVNTYVKQHNVVPFDIKNKTQEKNQISDSETESTQSEDSYPQNAATQEKLTLIALEEVTRLDKLDNVEPNPYVNQPDKVYFNPTSQSIQLNSAFLSNPYPLYYPSSNLIVPHNYDDNDKEDQK